MIIPSFGVRSYITLVFTIIWLYITIVKSFIILVHGDKVNPMVIYCRILTIKKCRYCGKLPLYFITLAPGRNHSAVCQNAQGAKVSEGPISDAGIFAMTLCKCRCSIG
jgi:hypothetical protein